MTNLNKEQIKELLPHREPMLLIDELRNIKKLFSATAIVNVKKDSFFVNGHFPGEPVMPGVLIVEHRLGYIMANAGVDASNLSKTCDEKERVLLLPRNPNATCLQFRKNFEDAFDRRIGVIISDSVGRAWRNGSIGMALGVAGPPALWDRVGDEDLYGRR